MSCSRCGQGSVSRPITPPTIVGRPGGVNVPARRPVPSAPLPSNLIRDSITGLRYIPNSNVGK